MGGLSFWHFLVIAVMLAVVFGHRYIPAALGALGAVIGQYRRAAKAKRRSDDQVIEGTFERRDD